MHQRTSEGDVVVLHKAMVEVSVKLLHRRKPAAQFRGVVFGNQLANRDLQRIVIPEFPTPILGYRHDGMGRSAPQLLGALQDVPGAKLVVGVVEKVTRCLCMLLNLHIYITTLKYGRTQRERR